MDSSAVARPFARLVWLLVHDAANVDEQKRALVNMLRSIQQVYDQKANAAPAGGAGSSGQGITMPYTVHEEAMTSGSNIKYNGYAHSFGGMATMPASV